MSWSLYTAFHLLPCTLLYGCDMQFKWLLFTLYCSGRADDEGLLERLVLATQLRRAALKGDAGLGQTGDVYGSLLIKSWLVIEERHCSSGWGNLREHTHTPVRSVLKIYYNQTYNEKQVFALIPNLGSTIFSIACYLISTVSGWLNTTLWTVFRIIRADLLVLNLLCISMYTKECTGEKKKTRFEDVCTHSGLLRTQSQACK